MTFLVKRRDCSREKTTQKLLERQTQRIEIRHQIYERRRPETDFNYSQHYDKTSFNVSTDRRSKLNDLPN